MNRVLRVYIFLFCLYLSFSLLLRGESTNLRVAEFFLSDWFWGDIFIRLYSSSLLFLGFLFMVDKIGRLTRIFLAILFVLPLIDSSLYLFHSDIFGSLFGFSGTIIESISVLCLTIVSFLPLFKKNENIFLRKKRWFVPVIILISLGYSFIKPLYIDDWIKPNHESLHTYDSMHAFIETEVSGDIKNEPFIVAFFTTTCPHCNNAALRMGINERNGNLPTTFVIFPGNKEDSEEFLKRNKLENVHYILVDQEKFLTYAGNRFPSIYYLKNKQIQHWIGSEFNFLALNFIAG